MDMHAEEFDFDFGRGLWEIPTHVRSQHNQGNEWWREYSIWNWKEWENEVAWEKHTLPALVLGGIRVPGRTLRHLEMKIRNRDVNIFRKKYSYQASVFPKAPVPTKTAAMGDSFYYKPLLWRLQLEGLLLGLCRHSPRRFEKILL